MNIVVLTIMHCRRQIQREPETLTLPPLNPYRGPENRILGPEPPSTRLACKHPSFPIKLKNMREQPWDLRNITSHHERWYQNILTCELLTQENSSQLALPLEGLLNESLPDELLSQLERNSRVTQALALKLHYKNHPNLELVAWKAGFTCAQERWKNISQDARNDFRYILAALRDCPFSGYPDQDGFLVLRALINKIELELRLCPHESNVPEVRAVANELCTLQSHWMRGFVQQLNPRVNFTYRPRSATQSRCSQQWALQD